MEVCETLERLGGISGRSALLRLCSRRALDAALADGSVVRVSRNRYVLPVADEARVAAARVHGVVSHLSAALVHGWKVKMPPARPSVTVRRNRGRIDDRGIDLHWSPLTPGERAAGVTDPVRTVVDCARALPFDEALAVADSALRARSIDHSRLIEAAAASPRTGRAAALRVAPAADGRAANPFESVLRAIALDVAGLHVAAQGEVGTIGHADLTDRRLRIALEAESFEFHALAEAFRNDVRRYTAMTRIGWLVVRFVWDDVMHRPSYVRAVVEDVVALRSCEQAVHLPPVGTLAG